MNLKLVGAGLLVALIVGNVVSARAYVHQRDSSREHLARALAAEGQLAAMRERLARAEQARAEGERYQIGVRNAVKSTEWGTVPVPANVSGELCKRARCEPGTVPASGGESTDQR